MLRSVTKLSLAIFDDSKRGHARNQPLRCYHQREFARLGCSGRSLAELDVDDPRTVAHKPA